MVPPRNTWLASWSTWLAVLPEFLKIVNKCPIFWLNMFFGVTFYADSNNNSHTSNKLRDSELSGTPLEIQLYIFFLGLWFEPPISNPLNPFLITKNQSDFKLVRLELS